MSAVGKGAEALRTFHDVVKENLLAIRNLDISSNCQGWHLLMLQIIMEKVDFSIRVGFESTLIDQTHIPSTGEFLDYVKF